MKFDTWSIEALRGYVVMTTEFLSGSIQEENKSMYETRLGEACVELASRDAKETTKVVSEIAPNLFLQSGSI